MPVRKFRNADDMNQPQWRNAGDPEIPRAMARLWRVARLTRKFSFPPGVRRFRSIEDMSAAQERWAATGE